MSRYLFEAVAGNTSSGEIAIKVHGHNTAVGTTYVPLAIGGICRSPQVSGATTLRIKAGGNANDTAAGSGAREVTFVGLDTNGDYLVESVATAGASASAATSGSFLRLFNAYVSKSGTYATFSAGSHAADIVIEDGAGSENWATIDHNGFPTSTSEIGCYSIPKGKTGYITGISYTVDSTKTTNIKLFKREKILDTVAPYQPMIEVFGIHGVAASEDIRFAIPLGPFPELTDIMILANVSATTSPASVFYELLIRDKE